MNTVPEERHRRIKVCSKREISFTAKQQKTLDTHRHLRCSRTRSIFGDFKRWPKCEMWMRRCWTKNVNFPVFSEPPQNPTVPCSVGQCLYQDVYSFVAFFSLIFNSETKSKCIKYSREIQETEEKATQLKTYQDFIKLSW